jgi:threonine dehydrogenase-like Zn-dependent dehydrogenase
MKTEKGRAMVSFGPGIPWEMREYPVPDPAPDAVVTRITMSSICGSDVHLYKGEFGGSPPGVKPKPKIAGHEFVGRVYKLGSNIKADFTGQPLKEGDRVVGVTCTVREMSSLSSEIAIPCPRGNRHAGTTSDEHLIWRRLRILCQSGQWIYKIRIQSRRSSVMLIVPHHGGYALHKAFSLGLWHIQAEDRQRVYGSDGHQVIE